MMETQPDQEQKGMSGSFFFLSLGSLVSLIVSITAFLNLAFDTLNRKFPDALSASYQYGYFSHDYEGMRTALATLVIFFPVFLLVSRYFRRFSRGDLSRADETVRNWLIYVVLFLSALVSVVDLVVLVRYFVSGEITIRFILKVAMVLIVALFAGTYYLLEFRRRDALFGFRTGLWAALKSGTLVLLLVIWSFTVLGTPGEQRAWRLDNRRVNDLQNIQYQVINYWQQKEKLPENIYEEINNPSSGTAIPFDPEFEKDKVYEYRVKDKEKLVFELCATFAAPMPRGRRERARDDSFPGPIYDRRDMAVSYPNYGGTNEFWDHGAGRTCFERAIDPDIYPPFPKPVKQ